jgi:hypothetical protein
LGHIRQKETEHKIDQDYQELGCVGFYGIQTNEDIMISMILLNNCSDIADAQSNSSIRALFNNIQQYLVPDIQMMTLKSALKKILEKIVDEFEGEKV